MPQLNQLADAAYSQFFWLLLVLALIYFGIGHFMVPKIQSTVDARDARIAEDLAAAQRARAAAEQTEADYRARIDESRAEALKVAQAAKVASARTTEERVRSANEEIGTRVTAAEARIRAAADSALGEIEGVAAEAAREMVERLAGIAVGGDEAAQAVKAAMAHV
ncbi:MAG: F-type H+-transporting ATPase subunit b [Sphingomonadales bacterium]|jgi:F-type H+-transporting ATPase subunit b|nr:F-type H+-transporting ATPase subunit b [Sphingomonadales bacterium]